MITQRIKTGSGFSVGLVFRKTMYKCQRCLNHELVVPRKGHKRHCPYTWCECVKCSLVAERKLLNKEINDLEKKQSNIDHDLVDLQYEKRIRNPKCARCSIHVVDGEPPALKGHKRVCPFQNCVCRKCQLVSLRRSIMAKQIQLRRFQRMNKEAPSKNSSEKANSLKQNIKMKQFTIFPSFNTSFSESTCLSIRLTDDETPGSCSMSSPKSRATSGSNLSSIADDCAPTCSFSALNTVQRLPAGVGIKTLSLPVIPASALNSSLVSKFSSEEIANFRQSAFNCAALI